MLPLVVSASAKARGVHFRPWIVTSAGGQHPAYVVWCKQPPERRGASKEVLKTLAKDRELQSMFAGPVDRGFGQQRGSPRLGDQAVGFQGGSAHRRPAGRAGPKANNPGAGQGLPVGATGCGKG